MSDIGLLNNWSSLAFLVLLFASPGIAIGALAGALAWRRHRVAGLFVGAILGGAVCFVGWLWLSENL